MEPVASEGNRETGPLTLDQAAAAFAKIRNPTEGTPNDAPVAAEADAEAEDAQALEVEADADEAAPSEELEADGTTEDDLEQPEVAPEFHTVKVDGKEIEVSTEELKRGYQRLSDYTRKTQAVAAERQQVEQLAASYQAAQQQLAERLDYISQLAPPTPEPNWEALRDDPYAFAQAQADWFISQRKQQALQHERTQLAQQQAAQQQQQLAAHGQSLRPKIAEVIPEWRDAKVAETERKGIREYMTTELGLPPEFDFYELWQIRAARDAYYGHQARKASTTVKAKLQHAKPGPVMRSGAPAARPSKTSEVAASMAQLKRTGDPRDAVAVFAKLRKG